VFTLGELEAAARLVHAAFSPTPQYAWPLLAERVGAEVWVKHENHTPTGAFKVRGGLVFMERLKHDNPGVPGVVSATRGNHGQSLAYAGARHGIPVTILVPRGNSAEKNNAMRAQGARLIEHGADFDEAREEAADLANYVRWRCQQLQQAYLAGDSEACREYAMGMRALQYAELAYDALCVPPQ
jgi:threonine dehydratase